jgi:RNA polymerase sigma factor (sigma-70 family)
MIEKLYQKHSGELYSYLARRCPDTATAGDLLQETFLQVVRQTDQLPTVTMPRAWLFGIARHMLARHYRRQRDPLPVAQTWYESEPTAKDDRLAAMREAIRTLPAELRDTLELRLEQELSYEEIAHVLDIPIGTVRSRLHNAVRQLRGTMTKPEETNS